MARRSAQDKRFAGESNREHHRLTRQMPLCACTEAQGWQLSAYMARKIAQRIGGLSAGRKMCAQSAGSSCACDPHQAAEARIANRMLCCTRLARLHSASLHKVQLQRLALPSVRRSARRPAVAIAMPSDDHHASKNGRSRPDIAKDCLEFINYAWTQFHAVGES